MISFKDIKYDNEVIENIKAIGNSCGVISIYFLSLIYKVDFNIEEFRNIGKGLTHKKIQDWAARNGIRYKSIETENYKRSFSFADYETLLKNDIVFDLAGESFNDDKVPHTSLVKCFDGKNYKLLFSAHEGNIDTKNIKGLYVTIYYKPITEIDTFVVFYHCNFIAKIKSIYENNKKYLSYAKLCSLFRRTIYPEKILGYCRKSTSKG